MKSIKDFNKYLIISFVLAVILTVILLYSESTYTQSNKEDMFMTISILFVILMIVLLLIEWYFMRTLSREMKSRMDAEAELDAALQQLDKIICRYDLKKHELHLPKGFARDWGYGTVIKNMPAPLFKRAETMMDEGSVGRLERFHQSLLDGNPHGTLDLYVKLSDGTYKWERYEFISIFEDGMPVRAIISIEDMTQLYRAEKDDLTGLYNRKIIRKLIIEELERAEDEGVGKQALLLFDMDGLKSINDIMGHAAGDRAIVAFAKKLEEHFNRHGLLGRIGGDEFIGYISDASDIQLIHNELNGFFDSLTEISTELGMEGMLSVSVGIAIRESEDDDFDGLYKHADSAMYSAKRRGKATFEFYSGKLESTKASDYKDQLTGHLNYAGFKKIGMDILETVGNRKYAVYFYNIKDFGYINDFFGFKRGNMVLRYIADFFESVMREDEVFCRVSADNFALLRWYESEDELRELYRIDEKSLTRFCQVQFGECPDLELSAGVYLVDYGKNISIEKMVNLANVAEKDAKKAAGKPIMFYDDELHRQMLRRLKLESQIVQAINNREFQVWLQPKICVNRSCQSETLRAEALARWVRYGEIYAAPGEFIPIMEKNGKILEFDMYMCEEACKLKKRLEEKYGVRLHISINASRLTLLDMRMVERYERIFKQCDVNPEEIEVEFTESIAVNNMGALNDAVKKLKALGCSCSIDDFGSKHSSLNVLQHMPLDVLKIDKKFFERLGDDKRQWLVIKNVINMARDLSMTIVAEGVETEDQVGRLTNAGCDYIQGFVFARPMNESKMGEWICSCKNAPDVLI